MEKEGLKRVLDFLQLKQRMQVEVLGLTVTNRSING